MKWLLIVEILVNSTWVPAVDHFPGWAARQYATQLECRSRQYEFTRNIQGLEHSDLWRVRCEPSE